MCGLLLCKQRWYLERLWVGLVSLGSLTMWTSNVHAQTLSGPPSETVIRVADTVHVTLDLPERQGSTLRVDYDHTALRWLGDSQSAPPGMSTYEQAQEGVMLTEDGGSAQVSVSMVLTFLALHPGETQLELTGQLGNLTIASQAISMLIDRPTDPVLVLGDAVATGSSSIRMPAYLWGARDRGVLSVEADLFFVGASSNHQLTLDATGSPLINGLLYNRTTAQRIKMAYAGPTELTSDGKIFDIVISGVTDVPLTVRWEATILNGGDPPIIAEIPGRVLDPNARFVSREGTASHRAEGRLIAYPNPARDHLHVEIARPTGALSGGVGGEVMLYDMLGRVVLRTRAGQIDMASLPRAPYLVCLKLPQSSAPHCTAITKQ